MTEVVMQRSLSQRIRGVYPERALGNTVYWSMEEMLRTDVNNEDITVHDVYDAFKKVSIVRRSITSVGFYTVRKGFQTEVTGPKASICEKIKEMVDKINRIVNLDNVLYTSVVKRQVWGKCAWEIAPDNQENIASLVPLVSNNIHPVVNSETLAIEYFVYRTNQGERKLLPDDILYFNLDSLELDQEGISSIQTVMGPIKSKMLYERDLKEASKRHWAPIGLFQMDTADIRGQSEKTAAMIAFKDQLKPGQSVVYNKKIEAKVVDLKPDLGAIIRAIEKVDEEIIGNWGIPKMLLGREKTTMRASLEAALIALYDGPIGFEQLYFRRALERQWYDLIVRKMGYDPFVYRVKHQWTNAAPIDYQLLRACTYAGVNGMMTKEEMFDIMNIEQYMKSPQTLPPKSGGGPIPEDGSPADDGTPGGPVDSKDDEPEDDEPVDDEEGA